MSQLDLQLMEFSREVGDVLHETIEFYPQLYAAAATIAQTPPSPSIESEFIEVRNAASDWADTMALLSRSITNTAHSYTASVIGQEHHPMLMRTLLLDILESCLLLARVASLGELPELSIMTPDELQARFDHPQVSVWINQNRRSPVQPAQVPLPQPPANSPAPGPVIEPTGTAPLEPSPYPSAEPVPLEPSPYPSAEPEIPAAPVSPQVPLEPVMPPNQAPVADPWNQPPARPSTDGDRSRNRPL